MLSKPIVSICCVTFNHVDYIKECIEGFLSQKTDFLFEILIFDDASSDGTQDVIKEYAKNNLNIITFLQKENQWSKNRYGLIDWLFPASKGKYIAICEGDDYWTDPLKLQKQVDFLEANPDYSMCTHVANEVNEINNTKYSFPNTKENTTKIIQDYISNNLTATCSLIFKAEYFKNVPNWFDKIKFGDWGLMLLIFYRSNKKMMILKDCMSVYRVHFTGIHGSLKKDNQSLIKAYKMHLDFIETINEELFLKKEFSKEILKKKINVYFIIAGLYKKNNILNYFKFRIGYVFLKLKHNIIYSK